MSPVWWSQRGVLSRRSRPAIFGPREVRYPQARVYYERIEPVAEIWGSLDTSIDGRWKNPVTVKSQFVGFHRIEQLLWADHTLRRASGLCAGLVHHEQQLKALVSKAEYTPIELASGATDLINEAATAKISGEEERYSNTDFVVFAANVEAAQAVVGLLTPYLKTAHARGVVADRRAASAVMALLATYQRTPGYDDTGYVDYSLGQQRRPPCLVRCGQCVRRGAVVPVDRCECPGVTRRAVAAGVARRVRRVRRRRRRRALTGHTPGRTPASVADAVGGQASRSCRSTAPGRPASSRRRRTGWSSASLNVVAGARRDDVRDMLRSWTAAA